MKITTQLEAGVYTPTNSPMYLIPNLRSIIYRLEAEVVDDLEFEHVADDIYTLDIQALELHQDTVVKLIKESRKYSGYRSHELLDSGLLRLFFKL